MAKSKETLVQGTLPEPDLLGERPLYYNDQGQPVFPRDKQTVYDEGREIALKGLDLQIEKAVSARALRSRRERVNATDREMQYRMGKWWGQAGRTKR